MLPKIELLWVLTWYYTLKKSSDKLVAKQDMDIPSRICMYEMKMKFALNPQIWKHLRSAIPWKFCNTFPVGGTEPVYCQTSCFSVLYKMGFYCVFSHCSILFPFNISCKWIYFYDQTTLVMSFVKERNHSKHLQM